LSKVLRRKNQKPNPEKLSPYESGESPSEGGWGRFPAAYYIVAILFIVFEVELAFLIPWALAITSKMLTDIGLHTATAHLKGQLLLTQ